MRPLLLVLALLLVLPAPAAAARRWLRPVPGPVLRGFDYGARPFAAGLHRGVDLAASPGASVRAACGGRVLFAGRVAGERAVSVRCGSWRVSYLGVGRLAVRAGGWVLAGGRIGRASGSAGHAGVHLGVRREGRRFAYVDPLPFLRQTPLGPAPLVRAPRRSPRLRRLRPVRPARFRAPPANPRAVAPWPVWAGLALALAGVIGSGYGWRSGSRERRQPCPVSSTSSSWPTTPSVR